MADKYRNILVAADPSESSRNALREICQMAKDDKVTVTAIAVTPPYEGDFDLVWGPGTLADVREPYEAAIAAATAVCDREGVQIQTVLEEGLPHKIIVDYADEYGCDLIVTGRRGLGRMERAFMGSVTARVIGHSSIDVLVFPRDCHIAWGKILLAVDGSKYSHAAADRAIDCAKAYGGEITAVCAVEHPSSPEDAITRAAQSYLDEVKQRAEAAGVQAEGIVAAGNPFEAVTALARERGADVIVTGSHGRTGLTRLVMGSVTEKIIGLAHCPVLVVRSGIAA
jgi:nucleotide-binding universal stress UspA family protein